MRKILWVAAALAGTGALHAHHSISMIEISTPIWVTGTVARYEIVNPHTMIELDVKAEDGQVERWMIEGPIIARIERMGVDASLLEIGEVIELCGFAPKKAAVDRRPPSQGPYPPWLHGHLIIMPDGRMQPWGPYGKLDNCVRPGDDTTKWLNLLNTNAIGHELWCGSQRAPAPTVPEARALAVEINESLVVPCGPR